MNPIPGRPDPNRANSMPAQIKHLFAPTFATRFLVILLIVLSLLSIGGASVKIINAAVTKKAVKEKQFQAVFLQNGQVYFGHLDNPESPYIKLTDIYYLQVQQQVQPTEQNGQQPQVSLAKLGNELHGPEDVMYISKDQVIFWENLKDDSKVVKAIKDFQTKK